MRARTHQTMSMLNDLFYLYQRLYFFLQFSRYFAPSKMAKWSSHSKYISHPERFSMRLSASMRGELEGRPVCLASQLKYKIWSGLLCQDVKMGYSGRPPQIGERILYILYSYTAASSSLSASRCRYIRSLIKKLTGGSARNWRGVHSDSFSIENCSIQSSFAVVGKRSSGRACWLFGLPALRLLGWISKSVLKPGVTL